MLSEAVSSTVITMHLISLGKLVHHVHLENTFLGYLLFSILKVKPKSTWGETQLLQIMIFSSEFTLISGLICREKLEQVKPDSLYKL